MAITAEEFKAVTVNNLGPAVWAKLNGATVAVAGLGGLGSRVAPALARSGVGKLIIVDFDIVEASNLNRQDYFADQLGLAKVAAMRDNLARINPGLALEAHNLKLIPETICSLFASADVIVECFDKPDQKQMIAETVLARMSPKPIVSASGLAGYGRSNDITTRRLSGRHIVVGDFVSASGPGTGLFAGRVGIAALHQANAVIELLINEVK
ncbi:MAG: thiamine biosynthesis protein ThiF [Planctomycetes bacterium GWF2_50_10]|nr:MAG: thiamine biosynthesis protein ThiF [Planctomycetes bacterium GWF2_50_10]